MRITGRQLRRIIQEEVARMINEEGTGGLVAAQAAELEPYSVELPGGQKSVPIMRGLYSQAGDRLVRTAGDLVDHISKVAPGGSAATGSLQSNMNDVVLNRPNGRNMRSYLTSVLSAGYSSKIALLCVAYILATGKNHLPLDQSGRSSFDYATNVAGMMTTLGFKGDPAVQMGSNLDKLDSFVGDATMMEDLARVLKGSIPANLR